MKSIKNLAFILMAAFSLAGCETIQKATNSTGSAFTLTGQWQLNSNTPENVLTGTRVTVAPFVSEGRINSLNGTANCLREADVLWKSIAGNNTGGFTISNLVSGCNGLNYQPANIAVINNDEIRLTGKNAAGTDITQAWKRVK